MIKAMRTAATGMIAQQMNVDNIANNLANVNTPGYTRQETIQAASLGNSTGAGFFGQGVQIVTVQRVYSDFLVRQTHEARASSSSAAVTAQQLSQLDNLLGDPTVGLSPELQAFFTAANQVANSPSNTAARQSLLSGAQALVSRFDQFQTNGVQLLGWANGGAFNGFAGIGASGAGEADHRREQKRAWRHREERFKIRRRRNPGDRQHALMHGDERGF